MDHILLGNRLIGKCLVDLKGADVLWPIEVQLVLLKRSLITGYLELLVSIEKWDWSADNSLPWLPPKSHIRLKRIALVDQRHGLRNALNLRLVLLEQLVELFGHFSL